MAIPAFACALLVLGTSCSIDDSKLRARPFKDSSAAAADIPGPGILNEDAAGTDHTEVAPLPDAPPDQKVEAQDTFAEGIAVGVDGRAGASPEVQDVAEAMDASEEAGMLDSALPLGTGGAGGTPGTGGAGGGGGDGMAVLEDAAAAAETGATPGTGGITDTGGTLGTGGTSSTGGDGGVAGTSGNPATAGAGGDIGTGGAGGVGAGGSAGAGGAGGTGGAPPAGLVAWWKMDEAAGSSVAVDGSGNGNDATLTGLTLTSAWTTGHTGGALRCDGSGSASVNHNTALDAITTGVTVSAWVYRASNTTGFAVVLSRQIGTTSNEYYWLGLSGNYAGTSGSTGTFISTTTVPVATWTHLANTNDGSTERIYVNGVQVASKNTTVVLKADTSKVILCGNQNDSSGSVIERWNGMIDDLQLYNRALTATEIANLAK